MEILFKLSIIFSIFHKQNSASAQFFKFLLLTEKQDFSQRFLQSENCEISNCAECSSDNTSCDLCYSGYSLQNTNCTLAVSSSDPSSSQMKVVIIMAFISIPLMLIFFCCFIYLFFKKKPNSHRTDLQNFTEIQGFSGRPDRFSQSLARVAAIESYINSGSNLMITPENFNTLFPVLRFELLGDRESCTICFEDLKQEHEIRLTPCRHVFHHECLYQWLVVNDQKRCPNDNTRLC